MEKERTQSQPESGFLAADFRRRLRTAHAHAHAPQPKVCKAKRHPTRKQQPLDGTEREWSVLMWYVLQGRLITKPDAEVTNALIKRRCPLRQGSQR